LLVKIIVLGGSALAIAVSFAWWLHSVTLSTPVPPPSSRQTSARMLTVPPARLNFEIDTTTGNGVIGIVNREPFAWRDIRVEVGQGSESFQCPALPTVGSGHTLIIQTHLCRSPAGLLPTQVCVVRVAAEQGGLVCAFEPCALVR
jgi:hypothetical protein